MSTPFASKKQKILSQLNIPDQEYTDLSPKGSIDSGVRQLVDEINVQEGYVTTSSCAGRVAVYLEGISKRARRDVEEGREEVDGIASGGKGGGEWLFVSHDPVDLTGREGEGAVSAMLGLPVRAEVSIPAKVEGTRFVRIKFEPLILHILTASLTEAQHALSAALTSGFRESGISSLASDGAVMVAVRTAGLAFDSTVAHLDGAGEVKPMVSEAYLRTMLEVANERFVVNEERKERFREALMRAITGVEGKGQKAADWEPADERRERKRAEGLRRKAEVEQQRLAQQEPERAEDEENLENQVLP